MRYGCLPMTENLPRWFTISVHLQLLLYVSVGEMQEIKRVPNNSYISLRNPVRGHSEYKLH